MWEVRASSADLTCPDPSASEIFLGGPGAALSSCRRSPKPRIVTRHAHVLHVLRQETKLWRLIFPPLYIPCNPFGNKPHVQVLDPGLHPCKPATSRHRAEAGRQGDDHDEEGPQIRSSASLARLCGRLFLTSSTRFVAPYISRPWISAQCAGFRGRHGRAL